MIKIVAPVFEAFDNGEHFAVVDVIIAFCGDTLPRPEGDRVENADCIRLAYNARYGEARRIGVKRNGELGIEVCENQRGGKEALSLLKADCASADHTNCWPLRRRRVMGMTTREYPLIKRSIEIAEAKEYLDIEDGFWDRPVGDGTDTFRIHRDPFGGNDETKETNLLHVELTFLEFDE